MFLGVSHTQSQGTGPQHFQNFGTPSYAKRFDLDQRNLVR